MTSLGSTYASTPLRVVECITAIQAERIFSNVLFIAGWLPGTTFMKVNFPILFHTNESIFWLATFFMNNKFLWKIRNESRVIPIEHFFNSIVTYSLKTHSFGIEWKKFILAKWAKYFFNFNDVEWIHPSFTSLISFVIW